jgi:putative glycosyltransferase (TIGR04372 family)
LSSVVEKIINKKNKYGYIRLAKLILQHQLISRVVGLPLAVIILPIFCLLNLVFRFRIGMIRQERYGHLAMNTELFLRRLQLDIYPKDVYYYFVSHPFVPTANRQLLSMFQREITISESLFIGYIILAIKPYLVKTPFYQPLELQSNEYFEFQQAQPSLTFSAEEFERGGRELKKMGIDLNKDWYVCIYARDSAYLDSDFPERDWSYSDFRNVCIETYKEAIQFIVEKGGWVIRMGSVVKNPLSIRHKRIIDYANSKYSSPFLDIFLTAHCKFYLSSDGGGSDPAMIFDRPIIWVSNAEIEFSPIGKNALAIPKKIRNCKTKQYLPYYELLEKKVDPSGNHAKSPELEYEDNSSREILDVTMEMYKRLEGDFIMTEEESLLIRNSCSGYWSRCRNKQIKTPVGLQFLKENKNLYFHN